MLQARYCLLCGTPLQERPVHGRLRPVCPSCGYVHYVNPIVAAGALVTQEDKVLLIRRAVAPAQGAWGLPAGYAEADETPEEAARREVEEETGIQIEIEHLWGIYPFSESPVPGLLVLYHAHPLGGKLAPGDDALEARFFHAADLPEDIAFRTHRRALEEWARAHRLRFVWLPEALAEPLEGMPPIPPQAEQWHRQGNALLLACDGNKVIGWVAMALKPPVRVEEIYVVPERRRLGIGSRLLAQAHVRLRECTSQVLAEIPVDSPVLGFFLKAGYVICGAQQRGSAWVLRLMRNLAEPHRGARAAEASKNKE